MSQVVLRRLSRTAGISPTKRDVLPRFHEPKARSWPSPKATLSLVACSVLCVVYLRGGEQAVEPPAMATPVIDSALAEALRVESEAARATADVQVVSSMSTGSAANDAPMSPLPLAPFPPPQTSEQSEEERDEVDAAAPVAAAERVEEDLEEEEKLAGHDLKRPSPESLNGLLQAAKDAKAMADAKAAAQARMRDAMARAKANAAERARLASAKQQSDAAERQSSAQRAVLDDLDGHHASGAAGVEGRVEGGEQLCVDKHASCHHWAKVGECTANQLYMSRHCAASCGVCQRAQAEVEAEEAALAEDGNANSFECVDLHPRCEGWSRVGECERNPGFMHADCPVSCGSCATAERMSRLRVKAGLPP